MDPDKHDWDDENFHPATKKDDVVYVGGRKYIAEDAALSPTPSPDAIVRAALERAAEAADAREAKMENAAGSTSHVASRMVMLNRAGEASGCAASIRAIAADPKARAQIIEAAKGVE